MAQVFLATGFNNKAEQVPVLIGYNVVQGTQKELHSYDFRVFAPEGSYNDSIEEDIFKAIKEREYPINLMPAVKIDITFNV